MTTASILRADARHLPLADDSVDLIVTSPPYFALRSYQDGGEHYDGQIGDEATPAEFVDALIEVTRECVRVLKPSGSAWINLGDKYASNNNGTTGHRAGSRDLTATQRGRGDRFGIPNKSLMGIPWRYAIRCIDELGLILRAEVVWSKPNGLPESVTDRVRRSHEQWFHFTVQPRYYSAVDEIREAQTSSGGNVSSKWQTAGADGLLAPTDGRARFAERYDNPLGKLPGSVWTIPTEPLIVPPELGVDHFAAFPTEWPRRIIQGWSPAGVCVECGEGRRPVAGHTAEWAAFKREHGLGDFMADNYTPGEGYDRAAGRQRTTQKSVSNGAVAAFGPKHTITGYACACPEPTAPTTPGTVLDPFGGTGTTALVAKALGRTGISVDMSADYCRLAEWRTNDPAQLAKAARKPYSPSPVQPDEQGALFDLGEVGA